MFKYDDPTTVLAKPAKPAAGVVGWFDDGDIMVGRQATMLRGWFLNMLQDEMVGVLTAAGIAPDRANDNQLVTAIQSLIQAGGAGWAVDTGGANALVITPVPALAAYAAGVGFRVKVAAANTGPSTISVSGLGAKAIKRPDGSALKAGDLVIGEVAMLVYDGVNFQVTALEDPPVGTPRYVNADGIVAVGTYLVDTFAGVVTLILPADPAVGDAIVFIDARNTWATHNLILGRNGHTIMGFVSDLSCDLADQQFTIWWNGADWRLN